MTPERALEHDERTCSAPTCQPQNGFVCAQHRLEIAECALTAARQREEEAKGERDEHRNRRAQAERHLVARIRLHDEARAECDALRAEITRLTLAASESARTIERLKSELETHHGYYKCVAKVDVDAARVQDAKELAALQAQVTALREALMELRHVMQFLEVSGRDRDLIAIVGRAEERAAQALFPQDGA